MADANATLAKSTAEAAVSGGLFTSNDDNALFRFLSATHTNPLYEDLVQSGRNDFVPANTIVDIMNNLSDPRRPLYFTTIGGVYSGGQYGYESPYSLYSHLADAIHQPNFPGIIMTYDEVRFYLAEAVERGFSVGGTASAHYEAGIKASIMFWGGLEADADTYIAQPSVAYATATGNWRQKIGTQAWIALYTRGLEGYTTWRRMDYPTFNVGSLITSYDEIPIRFPYPVSEQTLNNASYTAAASAIGGDLISTPIFWDVN